MFVFSLDIAALLTLGIFFLMLVFCAILIKKEKDREKV